MNRGQETVWNMKLKGKRPKRKSKTKMGMGSY
jgi:hypothetical protein